MKVKVDLRNLEVIEKEIEVISKQNGEYTRQGMPKYIVEEINGKVYFDKDEFIELVTKEVNNQAHEKMIFGSEVEFKFKTTASCQNGFDWLIIAYGEPKEDEEGNVYFEKFEVV